MLTNKLTQKNYITFGNVYQLKLPLNIECIIPKDDSVRLLGQIVEEMNLKEIYQSYSRFRNNQATPKQMLKILLYAYMNRYYSSRSIETACKRDINFMYLLEGAHAPAHATIARFRHVYSNIVADSGYESEENYLYLEGNKQSAYIKPSNYEQRKTRKYKTDVGRRENMFYDVKSDSYLCSNQKKIVKIGIRKVKSKTGYISEKTCYTCEECDGCPLKSKCIKGNNSKLPLEKRSKNFEVSKIFQQKREETQKRITTQAGKILRMNRSIQAEGAFAEVKSNMDFRRFLCRGKQNVLAESILLGLAHNVNKLHSKIQNDRCTLLSPQMELEKNLEI